VPNKITLDLKVPFGLPLPDMTFDQFMELEDEPDRFERV